MKKREVFRLLERAADTRRICGIRMKDEESIFYGFLLKVQNELFLTADEYDFLLDGYSIRRLKDVEEVVCREGIYDEIYRAEGLTDQIHMPLADISDWKSALLPLFQNGQHIIIESEIKEGILFTIGRIERLLNDKAFIRHFDADGVWEDDVREIAYSNIMKISFDTRYITVFSKYLSEKAPT